MPTSKERSRLLAAFEGLRVADVRDGMDTMGFHRVGSMSPEIRPLWRTRACGIARTARYTEYDGPVPTKTGDDYAEWVGWYYREVCPYPWMADIQPGDFVVIDQSGIDSGLMGSNNTLDGVRRGAKGYVTSGGVRDTDEIVLQEVPFWSAFVSQSMVQGRLRFDGKDVPVSVGGATVHPGDVVVADGDGVIVVPRNAALDVAKYAGAILESDRAGRRKHYEALDMELDGTVTDKQEEQS